MAAVYTEGISWYTAYLLFDSPLCAGQEFSTRAVRHRNWPMARECFEPAPKTPVFEVGMTNTIVDWVPGVPSPHPTLAALHDEWFKVFEAELTWWKREFRSPCPECNGKGQLPECPSCDGTGKKHPTADKEPFRPALDRARWAIPGTISTGCCHTGHLRERARVLNNGLLLAQRGGHPAVIKVWKDIKKGYEEALPGMAGMGLREAVYDPNESRIPGHLLVHEVPPGDEVCVDVHLCRDLDGSAYKRPAGSRTYIDPLFNQYARVDITFQCSLAVSRDWHRHRTMYPWSLDMVRGRHASDDNIHIHPAYEPKSDQAKLLTPELLVASTKAFDEFMAAGDQIRAMMSLPLGTHVQMSGQAGLRNAVYMLELRAFTAGANFEYRNQAREALRQLADKLPQEALDLIGLSMPREPNACF